MIPPSALPPSAQRTHPAASSDHVREKSSQSLDAAHGKARDFGDLIDQQDQGADTDAKQVDSSSKAKQAEPAKPDQDPDKDTVQDPSQQPAQQPAPAEWASWPMIRLNLATAAANPAPEAPQGEDSDATTPQMPTLADLPGQNVLAGTAVPLPAGQAGPQAPGNNLPAAGPGTQLPTNPAANPLNIKKLPSDGQTPLAKPAEPQTPDNSLPATGPATPASAPAAPASATDPSASQELADAAAQATPPPSQLLKEEREVRSSRQPGSPTAEVPGQKMPPEVVVTSVRSVSPKETPSADTKGDQQKKNSFESLAAQTAMRISSPKDAAPTDGGPLAHGGEQDFAYGEVAKPSSTASHGPDISSMVAGSPAAAAATGAGARSPEVSAAGRIEFAPLIGRVWEAAEALPSSQRGSVDLNVSLRDNENVKIRVEMRAGEIHATIQTDSPELRDALQKSWPDFVAQSNERGLRLGEANFSPTQQDAAGGQQSGADARREQQAQTEQQGNSEARQRSGGGQASTAGRQPQHGPAKAAPAARPPSPSGPVTLWA